MIATKNVQSFIQLAQDNAAPERHAAPLGLFTPPRLFTINMLLLRN